MIYLLFCLIYLQDFFCIQSITCYHLKCIRKLLNRLNREKDISVSLRWVLFLSQWFITLCVWLYQRRIQGFKLGGGCTYKNCAERKLLGYFVWKIVILRQKIIFFPILGGRVPGVPPPGSTSVYCSMLA